MSFLHTFIFLPQIENEKQEVRAERGEGGSEVHPHNALSRRLRQKGEMVRVGGLPRHPASRLVRD